MKPGNGQCGGVDDSFGALACAGPDEDDAVTGDTDVRADRGRTGAIDHRAVAEDYVNILRGCESANQECSSEED
jgi:hypothetical protein